MIGYLTGQDGAILPTWDYPLYLKENKWFFFHMINPLLTKLFDQDGWDIGLAAFWEFMDKP